MKTRTAYIGSQWCSYGVSSLWHTVLRRYPTFIIFVSARYSYRSSVVDFYRNKVFHLLTLKM